ncbi:hypothetical protein [Streptomyces clavifer]|uniref:hypothetical protein n=1 Tax=Streptomyces clavifer TaxID=68188 RepID=UPI003648CF5B
MVVQPADRLDAPRRVGEVDAAARVALKQGEAAFAVVLVAVVEADGKEGQRGVVVERGGVRFRPISHGAP